MSLGRKKHYFLPSIPESTPDGPIQLGSIISSPDWVFEPVNSYRIAPSSYAEKVYEHNTGKGHLSLGKTNSKHLGVFAQLPAFIDSIIGHDTSKSSSERWKFNNLRTIWFTPSKEYVRQSLGDVQVQQFVHDNKSWLGGISLYMVTGIKIAYGALVLSEIAQSYGFSGTVGVDLSSLGVPITVGPEVEWENGSTLSSSSNSADPVVFAFRLRRIKIKPSAEFRDKDYIQSVMFQGKCPPFSEALLPNAEVNFPQRVICIYHCIWVKR